MPLEGTPGQAPASTPAPPSAPLPNLPGGVAPPSIIAETTAAPAPVAEAPAADAPDAFEQYIESAMNPETRPDWMKQQDAELEAAGRDSHKVDPVDWNDPDPQKARLVHHNTIRRMHRATTEAAEARRELEAARAEATQAKAAAERFQREVLEMVDPARHEELAAPPQGERPDFYSDPDGWMDWGLQDKLYKNRLKEQEHYNGIIEAQKEKARQASLVQARQERDAWIATKPDFDQYFDRVVTLVQKHAFDYKEAYQLLKDREEAVSLRELSTADADARGALAVPRHRRAPGELPPTPDFGPDAVGLNRWYDQNPGTRERDNAEFMRKSGWRS